MVRSAFILAVASLVAAPASAQITFGSQSQPAPAADQKKGGDKLICERQEEIGSRLGGKKVCKTAAEWEQERAQQRRTVEDTQRQATSTGAPAG